MTTAAEKAALLHHLVASYAHESLRDLIADVFEERTYLVAEVERLKTDLNWQHRRYHDADAAATARDETARRLLQAWVDDPTATEAGLPASVQVLIELCMLFGVRADTAVPFAMRRPLAGDDDGR